MVKIVVGCGENKNVILAKEELAEKNNLEINLAFSDDDLISAMNDKTVDAVVRGSLKSSSLLRKLKDLNKEKFINRASFIKFKNELNEDVEDSELDFNGFLLEPVGIDEGKNIDEKFEMIIRSVNFILGLGKTPKIAILSCGRKEDFGRSSEIDKSLEDSEELLKKLSDFFLHEVLYSKCIESNNYIKNENINESKNIQKNLIYNFENISIKNYNILIEKAIEDGNNIIVAPNGIVGNIIFRTLVLVDSWKSFGAIALGSEKIFIDTSRDQSKEGYMRAISLAFNLANKKLLNK